MHFPIYLVYSCHPTNILSYVGNGNQHLSRIHHIRVYPKTRGASINIKHIISLQWPKEWEWKNKAELIRSFASLQSLAFTPSTRADRDSHLWYIGSHYNIVLVTRFTFGIGVFIGRIVRDFRKSSIQLGFGSVSKCSQLVHDTRCVVFVTLSMRFNNNNN